MTNISEADYPDAFTHPCIEYADLVNKAGLIDLTHWGAIRLTGSDRTQFLNAMVTNDVEALAVNNACHAAMTTIKGKLVAELYILKRDEELFVIVAQGDTARVAEVLDKHIIADDVELSDVTHQFGILSVEGPKSRELVWRIFPDGPLPLEDLAFGDADYQGAAVTVLRNSVSGEKGMQLIVPADHMERIRNYVIQAGRGLELGLIGRTAWNIRRVENGLPWFGVDIGEDNFPKETRLDDVVNYEKGCYLGQETLARMHFRGHPNWLLVGLKPDSCEGIMSAPGFISEPAKQLPVATKSPAQVKAHIDALLMRTAFGESRELYSQSVDDAKSVGRITSPVMSLMQRGPLLLGYVRTKTVEAGSPVILKVNDQSHTLNIVPLPVK